MGVTTGRAMNSAFKGIGVCLLATVLSVVVLIGGARAAVAASASATTGYWEATASGDVYSFGAAPFLGSAGAMDLNRPIVGMAATLDARGYWLVASDGGVFAYGDAQFQGSLPGLPASEQPGYPVIGLAPWPGGQGYWEATSAGDVYSFGSAPFFGSAGAITLAKPIVAIVPTQDGRGYWLVASDGGIFAYGSAQYFGSTTQLPAAQRPQVPVVTLVPSADDEGYAEVTAAGGVYAFGDQQFMGATSTNLFDPVLAAAATADGGGYWLAEAAGDVLPYGDASNFGSVGQLPAAQRPVAPTVALVPYNPQTAPPTSPSPPPTTAPSPPPTTAPGPPTTTSSGPPPSSPPPTGPAPTPAPLAVVTTQLPPVTTYAGPAGGQLYNSYSAILLASGGYAPYTWSLAGGQLPAGLELSTAGVISGTPQSTGTFQMTVEVSDGTTPTPQTAEAQFTLQVPILQSGNWAGYIVTGSNISEVSGTFIVPQLTTTPQPGSATSIWVGIDGVENTSLIQAGITEEPDPGVPGYYTIVPWWEILPAPATPITTITVHPGDLLEVSMEQRSGNTWQIEIQDLNVGFNQMFEIQQPYSGLMQSAEWIVEAPSDAAGNIAALAPFSPVQFQVMAYEGAQDYGVQQVEMVQNGVVVAQPAPPGNGGATGTVTYTGS